MSITPDTTVGTELEFYRLGTAATDGLKNWLRFHLHNDGSVRDATYIAGNLPVIPEEDKFGKPILSTGMKQQPAYGLEVITDPYTFREFMPLAKKAAYFFSKTPQNPRTSIHVHVDMHDQTWKEIQHLLIWTHAMEAIIYRIACGGNTHRGCRSYQGSSNDHRFARPLSDPIGAIWSNGKMGPLINWDMLANAKSASEMAAAWGRLDLYWGGGFEHYMPHRLHVVNIGSILRTGTFEWRVFDGLYAFFDVIVDFVYHFHALAGKGQLPDFSFPLHTTPNVECDWVNKLLDMDVSSLWGANWQKGCTQRYPLSHYPSNPTLRLPSAEDIINIYNGVSRDNGSDTFKPFIRGGF